MGQSLDEMSFVCLIALGGLVQVGFILFVLGFCGVCLCFFVGLVLVGFFLFFFFLLGHHEWLSSNHTSVFP